MQADTMNDYRAKVLRDVLDAGPNPGEDFYRLKVSAAEPSVWINVSAEQLEEIIAVFTR